MQDRSINVGGSFQGVANTGDNSLIQNSSNRITDRDVAEILADMLKQLAQRYPNISEVQKQTVFKMELQQKLRESPTLKQRFLGAVKAGGFELAKVLTNNPFVSVPIETVKGWLEV
ncbi:hypothetical protein H6G94_02630 [Nostoc punctiforme FACHB-252]|uniref:Uncharacterized protein n=1 Tax=Nostoc punctiforme FACHB-252 TaxID=1357509 RepID=A0ABR8H4R4_NOSPU|nr:hypothetical protein [Nostoc punctiforme]MBD2610180.1 hypothetical protein [Nostoc punctiforme FACHB-252]